MRYKLLSLAAVLLIASPGLLIAQEKSPIVVETGKPTPSVVRTGEPFKVTYRVRFYDHVLILEDQLKPDNISAEPFEVLALEVSSLPDQGTEDSGVIHVRDFTYTFRIIRPEKGEKKIPSLKFIWVIKEAGTTAAKAKEGNEIREMVTEEVGVRYVSSPVEPPHLDIRDEIILNPSNLPPGKLRNISYMIGLIYFSIVLLVLARFFRVRSSGEFSAGSRSSVDGPTELVFGAARRISRKEFLAELKDISRDKNIDTPSKELEDRVYATVRGFLLFELSGPPLRFSESNTPGELNRCLKSLEPKEVERLGSKYHVFLLLTDKIYGYYRDKELGNLDNFNDPRAEIKFLSEAVLGPSFGKRFSSLFINSLRMPNV